MQNAKDPVIFIGSIWESSRVCLPVLMMISHIGCGHVSGSCSCSVDPGGLVVCGLEVRACFSLLLAESCLAAGGGAVRANFCSCLVHTSS